MFPYFRPWFDAWVESSYGTAGFWLQTTPATHFRTASADTAVLAEIVADLLAERPEISEVVEIGAGVGQLLSRLSTLTPVRLTGIDLRPRPPDLGEDIGWTTDHWDVRYAAWTGGRAPETLAGEGPVMIICAEWLDDLPCPVVTWQADGWREVVVADSGAEQAGPQVDPERLEWLHRWWEPGHRAELGTTRDRAWAGVIETVVRRGGCALMIDYGHLAAARPDHGALAAYRDGHAVAPTPGAGANLTAHVAIDAVCAAGEAAGATTTVCAQQSEAIAEHRLRRPAPSESADALGDLASRSELAALTSEHVWGSHWWLLQEAPAPPSRSSPDAKHAPMPEQA